MTLKETFSDADFSDYEPIDPEQVPINNNAILLLPNPERPIRIGQLSRETDEIIALDPNDPTNNL